MKRIGYVYERMADWDLLKEAQSVSCQNKGNNFGVTLHKKNWIRNLVEIQESILSHTMQTSEYKHERKISGQGKMRDIAKLNFHPSHIQHQVLVMATQAEIDRSFIRHTYASRKGYGQHRGAKQLNEWVQKYSREGGEYPVYLQLDICKYYDHIRHSIVRKELERMFKDRNYIEAYMEPLRRFAPMGVGIPLGIRPSQILGNVALSPLDRFVKEVLGCKCYIRYLDDIVLLCRNKGEAHRYERRIREFLSDMGFELHPARIDKVTNGIDFLGYVTYPYTGQFWRRSNKIHWLKARSKVTNKRRLREIDASAWGYIKHGNKHGKRLYRKMGGISFERLGIARPANTDKNGRRIIDAPALSMQMVLDKQIDILDLESGVETAHGKDRVVMLISCMGTEGKLMVNAPMKQFFAELWQKGITRVTTVFYDRGGRHYDFVEAKTEVKEIHHRPVGEVNGELVYLDNNAKIDTL